MGGRTVQVGRPILSCWAGPSAPASGGTRTVRQPTRRGRWTRCLSCRSPVRSDGPECLGGGEAGGSGSGGEGCDGGGGGGGGGGAGPGGGGGGGGFGRGGGGGGGGGRGGGGARGGA